MVDIVPLGGADVRPFRRHAPSAHPLDAHAASVHLGAVREGELIGVVSAVPADPTRWRQERYALVGPFGDADEALVDALIDRLPDGSVVCADSPRPGLTPDGGQWTLTIPVSPPAEAYAARHIVVLDGLVAVRRRPGMYVGSTGAAGALHLVREAVDNALDEHLAGHASAVRVECGADGVITVADDGRGIPPEVLLEVCTRLHAGATLDGHWPHVHLGPGGLGLAVVNALSSWMIVEVAREGVLTQTAFVRGEVLGVPTVVGPTDARGTTVRFRPDPAVFSAMVPDLRPTLRPAAYLAPGLRLTLNGEDLSQPGGLVALVRSWDDAPQGEPEIREGSDGVRHVRLVRAHGAGGLQRMWVNFVPMHGGATLRAVRAACPNDHLAIDVRHRDPRFDGRTRSELSDPELTALILGLLVDPDDEAL